jgi:hypothetical protein
MKTVRAKLDAVRILPESQPKTRKIAGLGKFSSGVSDLGSNKKHLRGFGRFGTARGKSARSISF